ncbi:MAG: protein-L-isoaspartate(D-aspartate) O-methyltransferase [Gemmatimonadota bacterium]|nr:protein-L-isoaspartate(D-aspartate) O-methyltransferase [Gemmatimonadota bacterium]
MHRLRGAAFPALCLALCAGCSADSTDVRKVSADEEARFLIMRKRMVKIQIERRGIRERRVLNALLGVPRHLFVPEHLKERAYDDGALPIGEDQTISQPYIVAKMTELLNLKGDEIVLEVGTGSGYQAAVLAKLVREVYTIEIVPSLARQAEERLRNMGYDNVRVRLGDGYRGWEEHAPFDAVIVTAAPDHVPPKLVEQLREGGRMVIPVGTDNQHLTLLVRERDGVKEERVIPVRFVPMTGEAQTSE